MYSKTDAIALGLPCEQHAAAVRAVIARSLSYNCIFDFVVFYYFICIYFLNILIVFLMSRFVFEIVVCLFLLIDIYDHQ